MGILLDRVWLFFVLICAIAVISVTITKSSLFATPREFLQARSRFLGALFSCPYCFSHWLAFAAVGIFRLRLIQSSSAIADYVVSGFALVGGATFLFAKLYLVIGSRPGAAPPGQLNS